ARDLGDADRPGGHVLSLVDHEVAAVLGAAVHHRHEPAIALGRIGRARHEHRLAGRVAFWKEVIYAPAALLVHMGDGVEADVWRALARDAGEPAMAILEPRPPLVEPRELASEIVDLLAPDRVRVGGEVEG